MSLTSITTPLFGALVLAIYAIVSSCSTATAQETETTGTGHAKQGQQAPHTDADIATKPVRTVDGVLQLEATIRSSKQQPRVMSIVPWQLPSHKSVGQNQGWRLQQARLKPIERGQFLREQALRQQLWPSPTTAGQTYSSPGETGVERHKTQKPAG